MEMIHLKMRSYFSQFFWSTNGSLPSKRMQKVYKTTGNVLELPPRVSLFGGTTYNFSVQAIKKRNMVSVNIYQILKSVCLREPNYNRSLDR